MLLVICTRGILHANEISAVATTASVNMHVSTHTQISVKQILLFSTQTRNCFVVVDCT